MYVSVRSTDALSRETCSEMLESSDGGRPFLPQSEDPAAFCRSGTAQGTAEEGTYPDQSMDPTEGRGCTAELLLSTCPEE